MLFVDACEVEAVDPQRVASARAALISLDEASSLAESFKLLGDPTRARVLYALLEAGELCVCDRSQRCRKGCDSFVRPES